MSYVSSSTSGPVNDGNPTAGVGILAPPAVQAKGATMEGTTIEGLRATVAGVLGSKIELTPSFGSVDVYETTGHASTGIPYALHGSATQVSHDVGVHLAGFQDPIKTCLGVRVVDTKKVVVKTRMVVGGGSQMVPERSSARSIGIKEEAREIELARFGADMEMNLNLLNVPQLFRSELDLKMGAQKQYLEDTLVELGYEALMEQGTNLVAALARANASSGMNQAAALDEAEKVYISSIFGTMTKHNYPLQNLLAAARHSQCYTQSRGDNYSTLICPVPMLDLAKYTKQSSMKYSVSGLNAEQTQISMPVDNVAVDSASSIRIMTHVPPAAPSMGGSAYPVASQGGLSRTVAFATYYKGKTADSRTVDIVDFKNRTYKTIDITAGHVIIRPAMVCQMSSAILVSNPGSETGELLMAFPHTGVSTNQATESMKVQLRCYLGAAVYRPNNVLVLPDVAFDKCIQGHGAVEGADYFTVAAEDFGTWGRFGPDEAQAALQRWVAGQPSTTIPNTDIDYPKKAYIGHARDPTDLQTISENGGHLGAQDRPTSTRIHGYHVYDSNPSS